jgi:hypothetical protein
LIVRGNILAQLEYRDHTGEEWVKEVIRRGREVAASPSPFREWE